MADHDGRRRGSGDRLPRSHGAERSELPGVGKQSLVETQFAPAVPPGPSVQRRETTPSAAGDPASVRAAAAEGVVSPASPLPHAGTLQQLFGRHDVSNIQAHTGPEAAASARAMGAQAYATGNHVVLGGQTDLHTVAHEAAHVVQQRGGVQLQGGVGTACDVYEQHADAVADAVVRGQNAEALLDPHAGPQAASHAVQRKDSPQDAQILDHQATLENSDVEIPALEGALLTTRLDAVKHGLLSKSAFDASLDLSQAMTQLQPANAAGGPIDVGAQVIAANAAQRLFLALQRDTADDKNFRPEAGPPSPFGGMSINASNPYTGESKIIHPTGTNHFDGPLKQLPTLIHQGKLDRAFPVYRELMNGLDRWVADQLRAQGKGSPDAAHGDAHEYHAQLNTRLEQIADKHATRIPALFRPAPKTVESDKAAGRATVDAVPMNVYFWNDAKDGKIHLYDLTTPSRPHEHTLDGPPTAAILNTFFEDVARYPEGEVRYTLPGGRAGLAPTTGKTRWYEWLGYAGLAAAAVGLALVTAGASVPATICFAAGALAGGVSSAGHLVDSARIGTATTASVVLDVAQIAASFAGAGAMNLTVKAGSVAGALANSRYFIPLVTADAIASTVQVVALTDIAVGEMSKIQNGAGSPEDKQRAISVLLTQLIVTGGLAALSVQGARNARVLAGKPLELVGENGTNVLRVPGDAPPELTAGSKPVATDSPNPSSATSSTLTSSGGIAPELAGLSREQQVQRLMDEIERQAGGLRRPALNELDPAEIARLQEEFASLGGDPAILRFNRGAQTGFVDATGHINVRGDVNPVEGAHHPRSAMSSKAVLGHELGHRAHRGTPLSIGAWNDEFRASYWAAKNLPNLSDEDRIHLVLDAMERAREAGVSFRPNALMRQILYGY